MQINVLVINNNFRPKYENYKEILNFTRILLRKREAMMGNKNGSNLFKWRCRGEH